MKKAIIFITMLVVLTFINSLNLQAQMPPPPTYIGGIKYQAVVRDTTGKILANKSLQFKIDISIDAINPGTIDSVIYSESMFLTSNSFGLVTFDIGKGGFVDNLEKLDWTTINKTNKYFINIYLDLDNNGNYKLINHSEITPVPYAYYASKCGSGGATGPTGATGEQGVQGITGPTGAEVLSTNFDKSGILNINLATGTKSTALGSWLTTGNLGLGASNYIGTNDAISFIGKTNKVERFRILSAGQFVYNKANNRAGDVFSVYTNNISFLGSTAISGFSSGLNSVGVYGESDADAGYGISAFNKNTAGTGLIAGGNNIAIQSMLSGGGASLGGLKTGVYAYAIKDSSVGVLSTGGGNQIPYKPGIGCGGAFSGNNLGIFAKATGSNIGFTGSSAGYFECNGNIIANVASWGWDAMSMKFLAYKIIGNGTVSTIVKDVNKKPVVMFAPEAPEVLFQDYGIGKLNNGRANISLDPTLTNNILVDETHPIKVFIQLEGDCKGVYVTNKTNSGFDVIELQGGNSNVSFSWSIVASRADEEYILDDKTIRISSYTKQRFPSAPKPLETKAVEIIKSQEEILK